MFSNAIFYRCYSQFITIGILSEIKQLSGVESSVLFFFKKIDLLYLIDLPLLFLMLGKYKREKRKIKAKIHNMLVTLILLILILGYTNFKAPGIISEEWSKESLYNTYGFVASSVIDNFNYIKNNIVFTKFTNHDEYLINNNFKTSSNYSQTKYKGKNLIIIQVESLQQFVINRKYNGKEITPNLNKLISQSLYFDNCYYQTSLGHTSDAELLTNTSLYPLENSSVYANDYNNEFNALPKIMDSIGYNTFAVHGNKASFWNRKSIYNKYEFNKFYSLEKLNKDEISDMGLSDRSLFNQNVDIINNNKKPFYDFTITLTSHGPFKVNNDFCSSNNSIHAYYNAINYTDKQIGMFVDKLKANGILDNSILVIYGDHNAMTINDKDNMEKEIKENLNKDYEWQDYQKVPLIIRLPDSKIKGVNHNSVGEVDVMPTILDLYGINGIKHFGSSVFDNKDHLVVLKDGSYVYGRSFYDKNNNTTYNLDTGKVSSNDLKITNKAKDQLKASSDIIKYNYLKGK